MPRPRPDHGEKPTLESLHGIFEGCIKFAIHHAIRFWARELGVKTEWLHLILRERVGTSPEDIYGEIWIRLIRYYETVPVVHAEGDGDRCRGCKEKCRGNGHYYGVTRPGEPQALFNVACEKARERARKLAQGYNPKLASLRTWLIMLTKRIVRDQIRIAGQKRNTGIHVYLDDDSRGETDKNDPTFDGLDRESWVETLCGVIEDEHDLETLNLDPQETTPIIRQNLRALDAKHRAILEHAYYDGLSDSQIADLYDNLGGMERGRALEVVRRIRQRGEEMLREMVEEATKEAEPRAILEDGFQTAVSDMPLSAPTAATLQGAGIETFAQLVCHTETDLLAIRGLGLQRLAEIKTVVMETGLDLGISQEALR